MFNNVDNNFAFVTSQANFTTLSQDQLDQTAASVDALPPLSQVCHTVVDCG
jgi:hypothetical protein